MLLAAEYLYGALEMMECHPVEDGPYAGRMYEGVSYALYSIYFGF